MEQLDPNTPAALPPPGVVPNFDAPSRAGAFTATCVTITALMGIFVGLRLFSRMRYAKQLGPDDYTCVAVAITSIAFTVVIIISTKSGYGRHVWDYPIRTFNKIYTRKFLAVQALYPPLILLMKSSLFLLYYRIFSPHRRTRLLIYAGIGVNAIFYTVSFALVLYFCGHGRTNRHCNGDSKNLAITQAAFNTASDVYLLFIPVSIVSELQLSKKRKIGVTAIFMTGSLAVICSILNLYYRVLLSRTPDFTWFTMFAYITTAVEVNVGIMCGCFPALPPIFRSLRLRANHIDFSDSRVFKWLHLGRGASETDSVRGGKVRLTLGSQFKGKGHFFTMKSLFGGHGTADTTSVELSLEDSRRSGQSISTGPSQTDIEPGLFVGPEGVPAVRERMET